VFYHQTDNSLGGDLYNAYIYRGLVWQSHLHKGFEFTYVLSGELFAEAGGKNYVVGKGEAMLITPFTAHAYRSGADCVTFVAVFSGSYVEDFTRLVTEKSPLSPVFAPAPETLAYIEKVMIFPGQKSDERAYPGQKEFAIRVDKPDDFRLKAAIYAVCSDFFAGSTLISERKDYSLFRDMLDYIETNYDEDVTLTGMAKALGYDYRYLSRLFGKNFSAGFKTPVNQYRVDRAATLIRSTSRSLSDIAFACGFQSIRSFNRAFRDITGAAPSALRKRD